MRNTTLFAILLVCLVPLSMLLAASVALADGSGSGALVDPTSNPIGAFDQLSAFAHQNVWLAIGAGVYFAAELLAKVPALSKLGDGRITLVLAGVVAVGGAVLQAVIAGGSMQAALFAGVAAVLAYVHPAAADVAAKKAAA